MADEEFEAPTELGLFSLATLKSDKALNAVAPDVADPAIAKRAVDGADMMQAIKKVRLLFSPIVDGKCDIRDRGRWR